jgi:PAS domain S-box-containing protein
VDQLRVSIDNLREGVQLVDSNWRYLYLNAAAAAHGQRPAAELVGRTMMDCYPGIEQTELFNVLQRVMNTRRPEIFTNEFAYPTGERRWFDLVIDPVPDGICVLSLDVTERETKQAEVRRLQDEVQQQRLRVFRATMTTVHDIVNNFMNSLQLVREEAADDRLSQEMLSTFDEIVNEAAEKLKRLSEQRQVREREMAIGFGIDYE